MTRTFSNEVALRVADVTALPRRLFRLHLDSGLLCYTDHTSDIVFQGVTYHSRRISHGPIKTYMGKQADSCTVTIDDVDGQVTGYAVYEDFEGRKLEVWQVFLSPSLGVIDGLAVTPTFSRASVAYNPDTGQQVASGVPRYVTGADGKSQGAILAEEGATNLLTANQATGGDALGNTTGFGNWSGGVTTITRDTSTAKFGDGCIKGVTDGLASEQGIVVTQTGGITPSQSYTFGVWAKGSGTIQVLLDERTAAWASVGGTTSSQIILTNEWQFISVTRLFGATGVNAYLVVRQVGAVATTIYIDTIQLVQKAYFVTWQNPADGARAADNVKIPTTDALCSRVEGTVSLWFKAFYGFNPSPYSDVFDFTHPTSGNNRFLILRKSTGNNTTWTLYIRSGASALPQSFELAVNTWCHVSWSWKNGGTYSLFVNGASIRSGTYTTGDADFQFVQLFRSGVLGTVIFDDIAFFNRALTAAEVAAMYALGAPSQETPETTALIKFNNSLTSDDKIVQFKGKMDMPTD